MSFWRTKYLFSTVAVLLVVVCSASAQGQEQPQPQYKSQEVSESDGIPVLIKHLPEWEKVRSTTIFARDQNELRAALGDRDVIGAIDFIAGTEAVTAQYAAGKLLIIEYSSPQASIEADNQFKAIIGRSTKNTPVYRRIGNYNTFVFDPTDEVAANALLDQVLYEKDIQWLGDNPFMISAERAFVLTTADIFFSTFLWIVMVIGFAVGSGLIVGYIFYRIRQKSRATVQTYTDAGGMTRLNLDGFTPDIQPERLLND